MAQHETIESKGLPILDLPAAIAPGVTTFLAAASRPGMVPYRIVILDATQNATGVGDAKGMKIKYPTIGFTAGEKVVGVALGFAVTHLANAGYSATFYPREPGLSARFRAIGVAPVMTDSSTDTTAILPGDNVVASMVANNDGLAAKGTLSTNALAANQHFVGTALRGVTIENGICLVLVRPQEA